MANKEIHNKATGIKSAEGVGLHVEQKLTYKDSFLPSPDEMKAYMEIDKDFCQKMFDAFEREQTLRHEVVRQGMKQKELESKQSYKLSWGGIIGALLSVAMTMGVTVFALYVGYPWLAGVLGALSIASIVGMFLRKGENK